MQCNGTSPNTIFKILELQKQEVLLYFCLFLHFPLTPSGTLMSASCQTMSTFIHLATLAM